MFLIFSFIILVNINTILADTSIKTKLSLPIACELDVNCWISRYMNLNTAEAPLDYQCGRLTDSEHSGVDFALKDLKQMYEGVFVLAPAAGVVKGMRDEMADVAITKETLPKIRGKECGNGVYLDHGDGLETQLCHLRRGSIVVKIGQKVNAQQILGLVGLSGMSEYPHVHISTFYKGKKIDPFLGPREPSDQKCGNPKPLWDEPSLRKMSYYAGRNYNFGVSQEKPSIHKIRNGDYRHIKILMDPAAIIGWSEFFEVNGGDRIALEIRTPSGNIFEQSDTMIPKYQARYTVFTGKQKPPEGWEKGQWQLVITYKPSNGQPTHKKDMWFLVN